MNTAARILVLSPHADDEVLGCGGFIARRAAEGCEVHVLVATVGDVRNVDGSMKSSSAERRAELAEAARILGVARHEVLFADVENRLDTLPRIEIVTRLDRALATGGYEEVFLPCPSHHQDHRVLLDAGLAALRTRPAVRSVRLVALYEYAWSAWPEAAASTGRWYVSITPFVARKLAALRAYRSQLQKPPHPLSPESVERLAAQRGAECGEDFAELFHVVRMHG
jgi:LmbE family N-acetylglucosaminyl deacetylase